MSIYRKKPVTVEARRLTVDNLAQIADWCHGKHRGLLLPPEEQFIQIETLEGEMTASIGDYVIQGVKGEFYPCKPDIFLLSYEPVEEEPIVPAAEPLPELPDGMAWMDVRLLIRTDSPMEPEDVQRDVLDAVGRALRDRGLATVRG